MPAESLFARLRDLGYTVQEPDRGDLWEQEEAELRRARRVALAMGVLLGLATALMGVRTLSGPRQYGVLTGGGM